jgi:hypothetical protein
LTKNEPYKDGKIHPIFDTFFTWTTHLTRMMIISDHTRTHEFKNQLPNKNEQGRKSREKSSKEKRSTGFAPFRPPAIYLPPDPKKGTHTRNILSHISNYNCEKELADEKRLLTHRCTLAQESSNVL